MSPSSTNPQMTEKGEESGKRGLLGHFPPVAIGSRRKAKRQDGPHEVNIGIKSRTLIHIARYLQLEKQLDPSCKKVLGERNLGIQFGLGPGSWALGTAKEMRR